MIDNLHTGGPTIAQSHEPPLDTLIPNFEHDNANIIENAKKYSEFGNYDKKIYVPKFKFVV